MTFTAYNPLYWLEEISPEKKQGIPLLAAHGLNQRPQALHPLLKKLESTGGFKVHLLHLPGHQGEPSDAKVIPKDYHQAISESIQRLQSQYGELHHFLGYSFGALMGVLPQDAPFQRLVLLAPALKLRAYTHLLRPVLPWLSRVESLSLGGEDLEARYRCHQAGVPAAVYKSFFQLYREFQATPGSHLRRAQGLVMVHPKDELISARALKAWVQRETSWDFEPLDNSLAPLRSYNHLCFDADTLGEANFKKLIERTTNFLRQDF